MSYILCTPSCLLNVNLSLVTFLFKKPKIKIKETAPPKQVKIAFVGDPGVGKSSIVNYSIEDERIVSPVPQTNLVDISFKKIRLNPNAVINVYLS